MIISEEQLNACAMLMVERFKTDPGLIVQTEGVDCADEIMLFQSKTQIKAFSLADSVRFYKEDKGFIIGYVPDELCQESFMAELEHAAEEIEKQFPSEALAKIRENAVKVLEISDKAWYLKHWSEKVFVLDVIVIDKSLKGTGACGEMLRPLIAEYRERSIPIVLQTHNPDNIPLYEHFGFRIIEKQTSEDLNLTCYSMAID